MKKIRKLTLNNFQGHKHSVLEFSDGVNIIVGDTDSGKSSLFRAIYKAVRDKPPGVEFVSTWADECSIIIEGDDGTIVERVIKLRTTKDGERKLSEHYYKVIRTGLKEEVYTGFSRSLPEDVQNAFNMFEIPVGNSTVDLNFSDQHNPYFLIGKSDGLLRMQILSKISHADILEELRSDIKSRERSEKSRLSVGEKRIETLEFDLEEFSEFTQAKVFLITAKRKMEDLIKKKTLYNAFVKYQDLNNKYSDSFKKVKELRKISDSLSENLLSLSADSNSLYSLQTAYGSYVSKREAYENLPSIGLVNKLLTSLGGKVDKMKVCTDSLDKLYTIYRSYLSLFEDYRKLMGKAVYAESFNLMFDKLKRVESMSDLYKSLYSLSGRFRELKGQAVKMDTDCKKSKIQLSEFIDEVKESIKEDNVCPVCLREIGEVDVERMIGSWTV